MKPPALFFEEGSGRSNHKKLRAILAYTSTDEGTMAHRYVPLPFAAQAFVGSSPRHAVVAFQAVRAHVEIGTGRVETSAAERVVHFARKVVPPTAQRLVVERAETARGPFTLLRDERAEREREIEGELELVHRHEHHLALVVATTGYRWDLVLTDLDRSRETRLPATFDAILSADGPIVACLAGRLLHVVSFADGAPRVVTLDVPRAIRSDVVVHGRTVLVLSGTSLLLLDVDALPFADAPTTLAPTLELLAPPRPREDVPATVAFVLPDSIGLDHPRYGRLRVKKGEGPVPQRGDQVRLDDVREDLPGVFRVYGYTTAGGGGTVATAPSLALVLPSLERPPYPYVPSANVSREAAKLAELAEEHRFVAPETLRRLLAIREEDPAFCRWLDRIGLDQIELRGLVEDWDADPCLLAFAGLGNGDEHALYIYPPALEDGREPPIVTYLHETGYVDFESEGFDGFLEKVLARADEAPDLAPYVHLVRERLGFPAGAREVGTAPSYLPLDEVLGRKGRSRDEAAAIAEARALEGAGDLLAAERTLVFAYLANGSGASAAKRELPRVYEALGWTLCLAHLDD